MLMSVVFPSIFNQSAGRIIASGLAWKMRVLTGQYCNESQPAGLDMLLIKPR
jgi:hypothetical protein